MKWYEVKERSAGEKRLILTYYIYKIFGKFPVKVIAFFVALGTFLSSKDLRNCSKKYLSIVGLKPSNINIFLQFLSYALAMVDKIEVFAGNFNPKSITTTNCNDFFRLQDENKGAVCIFSHVGNIDIARVLINKNQKITIILSIEQAKLFRNFLSKFSNNETISFEPVETLGIETIIRLKDKVDKGELIFIAGDRASKNSKNIEVEVLNAKTEFPKGTFKLAKLLEVPVFFVSCIKNRNKYNFEVEEYLSEDNSLKNMADSFAKFISNQAERAPFQFYHFYDFFKEN